MLMLTLVFNCVLSCYSTVIVLIHAICSFFRRKKNFKIFDTFLRFYGSKKLYRCKMIETL